MKEVPNPPPPGTVVVPSLEPIPSKVLTVVCHTPDCPNAETPVVVEVPEATTAAICGGCGEDLTDIATRAGPV